MVDEIWPDNDADFWPDDDFSGPITQPNTIADVVDADGPDDALDDLVAVFLQCAVVFAERRFDELIQTIRGSE